MCLFVYVCIDMFIVAKLRRVLSKVYLHLKSIFCGVHKFFLVNVVKGVLCLQIKKPESVFM